MVSALTEVLHTIARTALGDADDGAVTVGRVTLRPHQVDALRRVRESVSRVGGVLLADEPGLGKTFVALALAREFSAAAVIAPAALRSMWRAASARTGVAISFVSMEQLSRRELVEPPAAELVIVDEAHHMCNPAAARYGRLAKLCAYRKTLLLSATPVRNRRAELSALLALFMGPRAHGLGESELAHCIVRRGGDSALLPAIDGPHWHRVRSTPRLREMISALPPALPVRDGREASALLRMTLARDWASSLAALDAALKRRLQRGAALGAILESGRVPTRTELRAWVLGDDAVQLAFPMFVANAAPDSARMREVLDSHLAAVRAIRAHIRQSVNRDANSRAQLLRALRSAHAGARIVAFTAYASTAETIYRALRMDRGVALLTARGARTAGGLRPRSDVIDALASGAARSARDEISLVIATDLLSEGVNLQGASVIVHLDVPWTPGGLDQRVGRAARMGSKHARVHVHGIAPPMAAERLLQLERRFIRKRTASDLAAAAPNAAERLRAAVRALLAASLSESRNFVQSSVPAPVQHAQDRACEVTYIALAQVTADRNGLIAVVERCGIRSLVCGERRNGCWKISDAPNDLLETVLDVSGNAVEAGASLESSALRALDRWLARGCASDAISARTAPSRARRALHAQLDSLSLRAGARHRAAAAERIARVRALINGAISAGAELALDEIARGTPRDLESLLDTCEARLVHADAGRARAAGSDRGAIRALLLLRRPL